MHSFAPEVISYGGARQTTTVARSLKQGIEATLIEAKRTEQILSDFATITDAFAAKYTAQQDQLIAEGLSVRVCEALVSFFDARYNPTRVTPPKSAFDALPKPSYADITRTDALKQLQSNTLPSRQSNTQQSNQNKNHVLTCESL